MATQTDTKANIGVITLSRQKKKKPKTTAAALSTRRKEGGGGGRGGEKAVQKNQNWTMTKILR